MKSYTGLLILVLTLAFGCQKSAQDQQLTSGQLKAKSAELIPTFEFADSFNIELIAAEPLIGDPVAMEIDEKGQIYVVEMHGYPLDLSGSGVVKVLQDTDGDGLPDKSRVFADGLTLPTGIMRWKNGVIVTDAPDVWYLEDTDGDLIADKREVILTGFALSNPQHNVNSPVYGLDNGIYLANEYYITTRDYEDLLGDKGEEIHFPGLTDGPVLPPNAHDRSVRFRPDTKELDMLSSQTQYGHTFSPWGHYFQTSNANHLYHEVIGASYLKRNPELLIEDAMQYMPDYGRAVEVYPITHNPEHQLLTDVGTMTSACGINWYKGGAFPQRYDQIMFTAEPVHNLIRADHIYRNGGTFKAAKVWEDQEFLASTDAWFRPVQLYTGPDGAIYVVDYYRKIIEHPEWMAESVNQSGELYEGTDQGRIYRITHKSAPSGFQPGEALLDTSDLNSLVSKLESDNIWWRRNAQRLLIDLNHRESISLIEELVRSTKLPEAKVHGLWTLEGLNASSEVLLQRALTDQHAGVRENALRILERNPEMLKASWSYINQMAGDPDPGVALQLLATLGNYPQSVELRQKLLFDHYEDPWMAVAAFTSTDLDESSLLEEALRKFIGKPEEGQRTFLTTLSTAIGWQASSNTINTLINSYAQGTPWKYTAILDGLRQGVRQRRDALILTPQTAQYLMDAARDDENELRDASRELLATAISQNYLNIADLPEVIFPTPAQRKLMSEEAYADQLRLVAVMNPDNYEDHFKEAITPQAPLPWQLAAIEGLGNVSEDRGCDFLLASWAELTPNSRTEAVAPFMETKKRMKMLLQAVSNGVVEASVIGWRRTVQLLNNDDPEIKQFAREVLASESGDREAVVASYQESARKVGNAEKGWMVYKAQCATCHQYEGKHGIMYGPDLATIRNRPPQAIMKDILMPNRSIADGYELWEIVSGEHKLTGIISRETATTITLAFADGSTETISRQEMDQIKALPYSAMPTGLETQISQEEMTDLLTFIRGIGQ